MTILERKMKRRLCNGEVRIYKHITTEEAGGTKSQRCILMYNMQRHADSHMSATDPSLQHV